MNVNTLKSTKPIYKSDGIIVSLRCDVWEFYQLFQPPFLSIVHSNPVPPNIFQLHIFKISNLFFVKHGVIRILFNN